MTRGEASRRRFRPSAGDDAIDGDWLALVLELHWRTFLERRRIGQSQTEFFRKQDLAVGRGAETRRGIHDVSDHGELEPAFRSDVAGERLAEVQSDPVLELRTSLGAPTLVQLCQLLHHRDRG